MAGREKIDRPASSGASLSRRAFIGLGVGAGLAGAGVLTARPSAGQAVKGGTLVHAFRDPINTLDPPVPNSDSLGRLLNSFLDPLVWQPEPGKFVPGLAASWQVAPDATRFTFTLREGVKFHDGTPFNAAAVKATFDRIVDPQLKALLIGQLGPYDGTDVLGDHQVRVRFKESYPLFMHYLSAVALRPVSPTGVKKWGADFGQNLVGTGPFALTKFTPQEITFDRFADYNWAPAFLDHKGPAYLDKVVLRFVPESSTRNIALEKGESQLIDFVPDADVKRFRADPKFAVDVIPVPGLPQLLQLNVTKPPLDDKRVRQAIQYAVDQKKLCDVLFFGVRRPGYGVLASSTPGYWKGVEEAYKFSPDKAKALLDAAGWKMGAGGIREKGGEKLSLLYITTNRAEYTQAGEVVQDMLKQVGIEMKIDAMSNAASLTKYQMNEHHIGRLGEINSDPGVMAYPVHSRNIKGGTQGNRSRYSNPEIDAQLDAAAKEIDPKKRLQMYEALQKAVTEEAFILGTFEQTLINVRSRNLEGLVYDNLGRFFFHKTWLKA
jgi:peptide/nickel transport system substrate-binding protein